MKRIIVWLLTFATLFSLLPFSFASAVKDVSAVSSGSGAVSTQATSGTCGDNLTWSFDESTGVLSISGTGRMYDYDLNNKSPWDSFKTDIIRVEIADGLKRLGNFAFDYCTNLTSVTLPNTVSDISSYVFFGCSSLTKIIIPGSVQYIFYRAFANCTNLAEVCFEDRIEFVDIAIFEGCTNLKTVRIKELSDWFHTGFTYSYDTPNEIPVPTSNPLYYGAELYVNDEKVTHLVVPDGITTVPDSLFWNCSSITSIVLPKSVGKIEFNAFTCPNLTDVVFMNPKCDFSIGSFNGLRYTLHAETGSTAEAFAETNKRTFHACNYVDNGDGTHYYYCASCKVAKVENLPHDLTGDICDCGYTEQCKHEYRSEVTIVPTCTENGELLQTCNLCGYSITFVIPAKGHNLVTKVTEPTCTEQGYTTYSCLECGESYKADYTEALRHNYELVVVPPTCTEQGYTAYVCSNCGDSYTVDFVDATGHDWSDWEQTDSYTEERTCHICGKVETHETSQIPNPFTDISQDDYFYAPVLWAVKKGITNGTSTTTFSPNEPCTRAQIVTFLWRAYGCLEPTSTENPFTDIDADAYYYKAVLWAVENGITTGMSATTFAPSETCTRGQAVTFLYRAAGRPTVTASENPFTDVLETDYYYHAVLWAVKEGITMGISSGRFAPNPSCTRSQIVTFLFRLFE